jgi:hypothetical protein
MYLYNLKLKLKMKFTDFKTPDQVRGFEDLADMFNGDERIPLGK